ncbi:type II toxin-antitoxin system prevent-host-death family antitoxin [Cellulomonas sp. NPDC089187]|uniref:type II toxin-antitoxin system Phd/YefM family antitoxin n=1 Tax=Cellulomonas sp. NPDC089187 TaxID=3154970 RepID=UPI003422E0E5
MDIETVGCTVTTAQFRSHLGEYLDVAQREPVTITNRGRGRAVLVSSEWFDRAYAALEDIEDIAAAQQARQDPTPRVTMDELLADLGLTRDDLHR